MKRIICVLLSVCMLLCLAACQGDVEHPRESESTVSTESQDLTESTENKQGDDADNGTKKVVFAVGDNGMPSK